MLASQGKPYGSGETSNNGGIKIDKPLILKYSLIQETKKEANNCKGSHFLGNSKDQ